MPQLRLISTIAVSIPWALCTPTTAWSASTDTFAQFPAESAFRTPAPNLIVSVDNAPGMDTHDIAPAAPYASGSPVSRLQALKQMLRELFAPETLPDDAIRLAFQSTHGCTQLPRAGSALAAACLHPNRMATLRGATTSGAETSTRAAFLQWIDSLQIGEGESALTLLNNAGAYLMQTDAESPWLDTPGMAQGAQGPKTCRRAYHLLLTDGAFGATAQIPSATSAITRLPDGVVFDPAANPPSRIYQSPTRQASPSTLAWKYWATDLQPTLANGVSPDYAVRDDETYANAVRQLTLTPYWNPQNDPATWQHMTNFIVDFGGGLTAQADYERWLLGTQAWSDPFSGVDAMRQDLWHAALNSRGRYFHAGGSLDALKRAMNGIIGRIVPGNGQVVSGYASDHSNAMYVASYDASHWSGEVLSNLLPFTAAEPVPNPQWGTVGNRPAQPQRSTADKLDARGDMEQRLILTHDGTGGVPFRWSALHASQQKLLQSQGTGSSFGPDLVRYLRGDRSLESTASASGFRKRVSRQGDIVHSRIWHVGKPASGFGSASYRDFATRHAGRSAMLYVGGNDGMLHGFTAAAGDEVLAYVPRGVYPQLGLLADRGYRHHYYVDGSPFTGDAQVGSNGTAADWKTFLVGSLGAGGPGYFILDVTTPSAPDNAVGGNFTESNAAALVVMDRTDGSDPDIGHIFAAPTLDEADAQRTIQITRTNNQRWAVILGNGYGSANGRPTLLIQYLDGARELLKIPATGTTSAKAGAISNGLSAPQMLDVNSDGAPDFVYAGDLQGHLWKFDVAAASDQQWHVALQGAPLFTANHSGKPQPITAAPALRVHPEIGGLLVAFGTGADLSASDSVDASVQTVYSVMDYTRYALDGSGTGPHKVVVDSSRTELPSAAASRDELMAQSVQSKALPGSTDAARSFWQLDGRAFTYCARTPCAANEKKGWYLDLPAERERVLDAPTFYGGGNLLEITSRVPATATAPATTSTTTTSSDSVPPLFTEACEQDPRPGQTFRTLLNIATGMAPRTRTMDTNGDGRVTPDDALASRATTARHELRLPSSTGAQTREGSDGRTDHLEAPPTRMVRPSWRQLQ